jgi:hypothetical protein
MPGLRARLALVAVFPAALSDQRTTPILRRGVPAAERGAAERLHSWCRQPRYDASLAGRVYRQYGYWRAGSRRGRDWKGQYPVRPAENDRKPSITAARSGTSKWARSFNRDSAQSRLRTSKDHASSTRDRPPDAAPGSERLRGLRPERVVEGSIGENRQRGSGAERRTPPSTAGNVVHARPPD